ncbi:MAG: hypothetical protein ABEK50_18530 [bacterium]
MSFFPIHQMYGHILLLLLLLEVTWTLVESVKGVEQARWSEIKSKAVVGLVDLQALLGFVLLYQFWPTFNHTHPVLMILAIVGFHLANKQSDWARFGLQASSLAAVVFGYVLVVG